jgi:hypothetical protein
VVATRAEAMARPTARTIRTRRDYERRRRRCRSFQRRDENWLAAEAGQDVGLWVMEGSFPAAQPHPHKVGLVVKVPG